MGDPAPSTIIRTERFDDHELVSLVIEEAFRDVRFSDHDEHHMVARIRRSKGFVPELSLVAELHAEIVGHILLSKIKIRNDVSEIESLAMAPVSVKPEFQGQGIGSRLIEQAHRQAKELGFQTVVVIGHANYYPRFGYKRCQGYNIQFPFDVPAENGLIKPLLAHGLTGVSGTVEYPKAFFE